MSKKLDKFIPVDGKVIFRNKTMYDALQFCQDAGFRALFMPEIMELRNQSEKNSFIWFGTYGTPSVRVTGTTKQGSKVIVYGNVPNYFSYPKNIKKSINEGLKNGAGRYPQKEFEELIEKEDNMNVFVVDYDKSKAFLSENFLSKKSKGNRTLASMPLLHAGVYSVELIPFIGGEIAQMNYFKQHASLVGDHVLMQVSDDLYDEPYGRLLCVRSIDCEAALDASFPLSGLGIVLGTPASAQSLYSPRQLISALNDVFNEAGLSVDSSLENKLIEKLKK